MSQPSAQLNFAAAYPSGFMNTTTQHTLDTFDASSSSSFMASGGPADTFNVVDNLTAHVRDPATAEHREDGYALDPATGEPTYYNKDWVNEHARRQQLLAKDPHYFFLTLVAGDTASTQTRMFDKEALDEHARRLLHRASVADELQKTALTEVDRMQKLLKEFETKNAEYTHDKLAVIDASNLTEIAATEIREARVLHDALRQLAEPGAQTATSWLTFTARAMHPREGLDSVSFAERALSTIAANASDVEMFHTALAGVNQQQYATWAAQQNPALITLSAYIAFGKHVTLASSACAYVARRMHADGVFPATGAYAAAANGAETFCTDLQKLMSLLETDTSYAVTMHYVSARLYIHLHCMQKRWFGSALGAADECAAAQPLSKPVVPTNTRAARLFLREVEGTAEEKLFYEEDPNDASSLAAEQKKPLKVRDPSHYQDTLATFLGAVFRRGFLTLAYDTERLRESLCDAADDVQRAVLCADADAKLNALRAARPAHSATRAALTLDYFFGGLNTHGAGARVSHLLLDTGHEPIEDLLRATYMLYRRAVLHTPTTFVATPVLNNNEREWFLGEVTGANLAALYNRQMEVFRDGLGVADSVREEHVRVRTAAQSQLSGFTDALLALERAVEESRELRARYTGGYGAKLFEEAGALAMPNEAYALVDPLLPQAEVHALLCALKKDACDANVYTRALKRLAAIDVNAAQIDHNVATLRAQLRYLKDAIGTVISDFNRRTGALANRVIDAVNKRYGTEFDVANTPSAMALKLKQILAATYVPSGEWSLAAENTGYLFYSAPYIAALQTAATKVWQYVPNLRECSIDDLICDETTRVSFAAFVASQVAHAQARNPVVPTLNRLPGDVALWRRDLIDEMRRIPPPEWVGRGTPGGMRRNPTPRTVPVAFHPYRVIPPLTDSGRGWDIALRMPRNDTGPHAYDAGGPFNRYTLEASRQGKDCGQSSNEFPHKSSHGSSGGGNALKKCNDEIAKLKLAHETQRKETRALHEAEIRSLLAKIATLETNMKTVNEERRTQKMSTLRNALEIATAPIDPDENELDELRAKLNHIQNTLANTDAPLLHTASALDEVRHGAEWCAQRLKIAEARSQ